MRDLFFDKRGGEELLSIWWFFVLIVVGVGIVTAVLMFYSADTDVRNFEAQILSERVADCIVQNGFLSQGVMDKGFDILKNCKLNKNIFDNSEFLYINVGIFDDAGNKLRDNIEAGDKDFLTQCKIQEPDASGKVVEAKYYAKCFTQDIIYNYGDKTGKVEILTASNQQGRKIAV